MIRTRQNERKSETKHQDECETITNDNLNQENRLRRFEVWAIIIFLFLSCTDDVKNHFKYSSHVLTWERNDVWIKQTNAWKILKNSFSLFESKMLNDLLIKLLFIIFVNNQNVTNYVQRFKIAIQIIREMIINVSINNNLSILYFHLNFNAKFEQYRKHYAQIHEIVSNKSNSIKNINYAINRFLNICVNRSISTKSTFVIIVINFVSNSFFDKI